MVRRIAAGVLMSLALSCSIWSAAAGQDGVAEMRRAIKEPQEQNRALARRLATLEAERGMRERAPRRRPARLLVPPPKPKPATIAASTEIGMALECTEPKALMPRVMELAGQIASHPPLTARMVKTLLRQSQGAGLHDFLDNCAALQAICHTTDDHTEAVSALLDKREPDFKGN